MCSTLGQYTSNTPVLNDGLLIVNLVYCRWSGRDSRRGTGTTHSLYSPDLITCTSTGNSYDDCPCPRTDSSATSLQTNHGGIASVAPLQHAACSLCYAARLHVVRVRRRITSMFRLQLTGFCRLPSRVSTGVRNFLQRVFRHTRKGIC